MTYSDLLIEERPLAGVAVLRLNRPEALNALNLMLRIQLALAFTRLESDDSVRVIVMTGSPRAFCAGADLKEYVNANVIDIVDRQMGRLWDAIAQCRKPVVAAVRGHALGGGCELAMHADIVVAGDSASFGQPESLIGLMPGGGATQRLTKAVGKARAMKMMLLGEPISAADALAMGLVSEVVHDETVEQRATDIASQLASGARVAQQLIKEAVLASQSLPLTQGLQLERRSFQLLFATSDKFEGISARLEKRKANFL